MALRHRDDHPADFIGTRQLIRIFDLANTPYGSIRRTEYSSRSDFSKEVADDFKHFDTVAAARERRQR